MKNAFTFTLITILGLAFANHAFCKLQPGYQTRYSKPDSLNLIIDLLNYGNYETLSDDNKKKLQELISVTLNSKLQLEQINLKREKEKILFNKEIMGKNKISSSVVFWIAHFAVVIGFCMSIFEFFQAKRLRNAGAKVEEFELSLKAEALAFKSSWLGIIILIISLGFYFMYLSFVYPITVLQV